MPEQLPEPPAVFCVSVDSKTAFTVYPAVGLAFGRAIAAYSQLESRVGISLAHLMGANAEIGVAMYTSVTGAAAQSRLVLAAAREALEGDDLALFEILVGFTRSVAERRNTIAHGVWGYSNEITDAFILFPQKEVAGFWAQLEAAQHGRAPTPSLRGKGTLVYREQDFLDITERSGVVSNWWGLFWIIEPPMPGFPTRKELAKIPEIESALADKRKKAAGK